MGFTSKLLQLVMMMIRDVDGVNGVLMMMVMLRMGWRRMLTMTVKQSE